jgi:hypothetical protein
MFNDAFKERRSVRPPAFYLRYVTLGQALRECAYAFAAWAVFSALPMCLLLVLFGTDSKNAVDTKLPPWVGILVPAAVLLLLWRGQIIIFPSYGVRGWLVLTTVVVIMIGAANFLPGWAFITLCYGVGVFGSLFDKMVALGQENYEPLRARAGAKDNANVE